MPQINTGRFSISWLILLFLLLPLSHQAFAQQLADPRPVTEATGVIPAMFPHSDSSRFLISGQANIIFQGHGPFHSPYEGTNSFLGRGEYKTSLLGTLFLGAQVR